MNRSKLHNDILNLPLQSVVDSEFSSRSSAYMEGFTDARQDAAELVLAAPNDYTLEFDEPCKSGWKYWDWFIIVPAIILACMVAVVLRETNPHRAEVVPEVEVEEPIEVVEEEVLSPALKSRRHKLNRRQKRDRRR